MLLIEEERSDVGCIGLGRDEGVRGQRGSFVWDGRNGRVRLIRWTIFVGGTVITYISGLLVVR